MKLRVKYIKWRLKKLKSIKDPTPKQKNKISKLHEWLYWITLSKGEFGEDITYNPFMTKESLIEVCEEQKDQIFNALREDNPELVEQWQAAKVAKDNHTEVRFDVLTMADGKKHHG